MEFKRNVGICEGKEEILRSLRLKATKHDLKFKRLEDGVIITMASSDIFSKPWLLVSPSMKLIESVEITIDDKVLTYVIKLRSNLIYFSFICLELLLCMLKTLGGVNVDWAEIGIINALAALLLFIVTLFDKNEIYREFILPFDKS